MSQNMADLESSGAEIYEAASESIKQDLVEVEDKPESQVGYHTLDLPQLETEPDTPRVLPSNVMKGATFTAAAFGAMGLSNLAHPHKVGEVTPPVEPAPIVQEVNQEESDEEIIEVDQQQDAGETAADAQEQTTAESDAHQVTGKIESHVETAPMEQQWWKDVPLQSQQGLKYGDRSTQYGCTPASTSMILDYWHAQDPSNKTMSAQELLDINAGQGEFHSRGMSATNIHDEVRRLGYGVVEDHLGSNQEELRTAVDQGPVIGIVKLGMKASGRNHAVVVTGISDDNQVRVNDPWDGQPHTYSWDEFSRSWGADFGEGFTRNNFVVIRPS